MKTAPRLLVVAPALAITLGIASVHFAGCTTDNGAAADKTQTTTNASDAPETPAPTLAELAQLEVRRERPDRMVRALHPSEPPLVRARAALALARLQHGQSIAPLVAALNDDNALVRATAAFGLGQLDEAFDQKRSTHAAARLRIETVVVGTLNREKDRNVRHALIRALGRVGRTKALGMLSVLSSSGADREEALYALGTNGSRDRREDGPPAPVKQAIHAGLSDASEPVRTAAAYAAFRQKIELTSAEVDAIAAPRNKSARLHLLRALAAAPANATNAGFTKWLKDPDWRVRVRALEAAVAANRSGVEISPAPLFQTLSAAVAGLAKKTATAGAEAHVVAASCRALSATYADAARTPLDEALVKLSALGASAAEVTCVCAVARDAIEGAINRVRTCHGGAFNDAQARILEIEVVRDANIPSLVRSKSLAVAFTDSDVRVRTAAAVVAAEDQTPAVAKVAARALMGETDPGVIAAHLSGFTEKHREGVLSEKMLGRKIQLLLNDVDKDALEALLLAAQIADERSFTLATGMLVAATDQRIVDAARRIPLLDRTLEPRATVPDPIVGPQPKTAFIETVRGTFEITFLGDVAPHTVATFAALAKQHVTVGTPIHRVVSDFVAQGGDPRGDGFGGPGFTIPCERSDTPYERGTVGMALAGLDTGGSQFFVTHSAQPHLDGRYSVFGQVTKGMHVVDALRPGDTIRGIQIYD